MNGSHCTADAIQSFIDGDLTGSELKAAAAHLRVCAACMSRYEFTLRFDDAVKSLPMSGTGEGFTDSVLNWMKCMPG